MKRLLGLLVLFLPTVVYGLTVDAGPDQTLNFPSKDITLFGYVQDTASHTITWTCQSCPRAVTFSAPWAGHTTVTFTAPSSQETYTFRLSATNSASTTLTDDVVITLNPASIYVSGTNAFFVDPSYTGSTANGQAATPWKSLSSHDTDFTAKWNTIRSALASNHVIIYFSARQAGSDTAEVYTINNANGAVLVERACRTRSELCTDPDDTTVPNQLTLDGMSKYNTNDTTPSWADYTGTNRFKISCTLCSTISLGWFDNKPRDYVRFRGFEITGENSRVFWGGWFNTLEHVWVHNVTGTGPTTLFIQAFGEQGHGCPVLGNNQYITARNNLLENGYGEGIYIGSNYLCGLNAPAPFCTNDYGGCPHLGNGHSHMLIENNTINNAGAANPVDGEGDCIDIKAGVQKLTVRGNVCNNSVNAGSCINLEGVFPPARTDYLIEGNTCVNPASFGAFIITGSNHTVVRNNLLRIGPSSTALYISEQVPGYYPHNNLAIYNNTVYGFSQGAGLFNATNLIFRDNLFLNNGAAINSDDPSSLPGYSSNYNFFAPSGSNLTEGGNSITQASTSGVVVNAAGGDFHLATSSPAKNTGLSLSTLANLPPWASSFAVDLEGTTRPQGSWDMGMDELTEGGGGTPAPRSYLIVK